MDPMRLPKITINWKPEGRKKQGRPRRTWKDGIHTAMSEKGLRMDEWKEGNGICKSEGVARRFKTAYIYI
jgi:uncharacterized protein YukJ